MIIEKSLNDYGSYDITINDSGKILRIFLGGDDPNFSCYYENYEKISEISFDILEEQGEIYHVFDKLYKNIISGNVLGYDNIDESVLKQMELEKQSAVYKQIVQNEIITIISDAYPISCPNILKLRKKDDRITLMFIQVEANSVQLKNPYFININVRNSGSRLYDFCMPFKTLLKDLQSILETKDIKSPENKYVKK